MFFTMLLMSLSFILMLTGAVFVIPVYLLNACFSLTLSAPEWSISALALGAGGFFISLYFAVIWSVGDAVLRFIFPHHR